MKDAVDEIGKAVKGLAETVSSLAKSVEGLSSLKETVDKIADLKLDEKIGDVSKRLEEIEKQENPSNGAGDPEDVTKGEKKEVFWKSFQRQA